MSQNSNLRSDLLKGKKGLILGVANHRSIAWGIACALAKHGAETAFTYQGERLKESVSELVATLPRKCPLYSCDVTRDEDIRGVFDGLARDFGELHFLIHCIAYAQKEEMRGRLADLSRGGFHVAHDISAYSLVALARAAEPLMEKQGGSVVALTYLGAERVIPNYNVMGLAKASLEAAVRYLAYDLGPKNIRVNGISAGPVNTLAARGISGFTTMLETSRARSPLGRHVELDEIGQTAVFLAGPLSSGITGEILHVDCGYHIMGF